MLHKGMRGIHERCSNLVNIIATQLVQGQLILCSGYLNADGGKMT